MRKGLLDNFPSPIGLLGLWCRSKAYRRSFRFTMSIDRPSSTAAYDIRRADLAHAADRDALIALLDGYARDPMGGGTPLAQAVIQNLPDRLAAQSGARIWLAFAADGTPAGLAICFAGFSTFAAQPLLNLHDLAVAPAHRGRGVGRRLLAAVERDARATGCCKVTLEVRDDNASARRLYQSLGYGDGTAPHRFWSKPL
jgi:ribosomal protein S18 acetylase RimI-like enzyme